MLEECISDIDRLGIIGMRAIENECFHEILFLDKLLCDRVDLVQIEFIAAFAEGRQVSLNLKRNDAMHACPDDHCNKVGNRMDLTDLRSPQIEIGLIFFFDHRDCIDSQFSSCTEAFDNTEERYDRTCG